MTEHFKYLKSLLVILFVLFCIGIGVKYGIDLKYKNDLIEIQQSRNTFLDNYHRNKSLVESYLQVYDIVDENSYQMVKNDMYNHFSTELQKSIFPSVNYTGLPLHNMETTIKQCMGTNNEYNEKNTFLIEYNLKGINYNQDITNLIDIEDGVITRVIRIK